MSTTERTDVPAARKPPWLRVRLPSGPGYRRLRGIVSANALHTVCESAGCPNIGECWSSGVATMMILGRRCSRDCRFCGVPSGACDPVDPDEPGRLAAAVKSMDLAHVVLTSVTRDDLPDGGAGAWAATIQAVRAACPGATVEALVPDFLGRPGELERVLAAGPDILAHNVETAPRLYPTARPQADFDRSVGLLRSAAEAGLVTKSGLMVGLGESDEEVLEVLGPLRSAGVRMITVGQYLRPSPRHLPVRRYVSPARFDELARRAEEMGFESVCCGPLVRSSYLAERHARAIGVRR